jgi:flagellar hook-associated protein 3 FlgL
VTTVRVTQHSISMSSLANVQASLNRTAKLQEQMSSGKVINRPSDSPTGTVTSLSLRSQIAAKEQYAANAQDGSSWLNTQDTALQSVNTALQRVRDLTVQAASSGSMDAAARDSIASEITTLRGTLTGLANTTYLGRPVFGGTTAGGAAFDSTTYAYVGDSGQVTRRVDDRTQVSVGSTGSAVFGDGDSSVFAFLDTLAQNVRTNPSALSADLGTLDGRMGTVLNALTDVGVRTNQVEQARTAATDKALDLRSTLSDVEDIDLPSVIIQMQLQETTYQAALSATAKAVQPTLMDFLK